MRLSYPFAKTVIRDEVALPGSGAEYSIMLPEAIDINKCMSLVSYKGGGDRGITTNNAFRWVLESDRIRLILNDGFVFTSLWTIPIAYEVVKFNAGKVQRGTAVARASYTGYTNNLPLSAQLTDVDRAMLNLCHQGALAVFVGPLYINSSAYLLDENTLRMYASSPWTPAEDKYPPVSWEVWTE